MRNLNRYGRQTDGGIDRVNPKSLQGI